MFLFVFLGVVMVAVLPVAFSCFLPSEISTVSVSQACCFGYCWLVVAVVVVVVVIVVVAVVVLGLFFSSSRSLTTPPYAGSFWRSVGCWSPKANHSTS